MRVCSAGKDCTKRLLGDASRQCESRPQLVLLSQWAGCPPSLPGSSFGTFGYAGTFLIWDTSPVFWLRLALHCSMFRIFHEYRRFFAPANTGEFGTLIRSSSGHRQKETTIRYLGMCFSTWAVHIMFSFFLEKSACHHSVSR